MSETYSSIELSCLNCGQENDTEFHEIFDEVGIELELDKLLAQHFQLVVQPLFTELSKQVLCDKCVNRLIELFDLAERAKNIPTQDENTLQLQDNARSSESIIDSFEETCEIFEGNEKSLDQAALLNDDLANVDDELNDYSAEIGYDAENSLEEFDNVDNEELSAEQQFHKDDENNLNEEEVQYAAEIDNINVQEYLDSVINSKLEDLQINWSSECRFCSIKFETFQQLLRHIEIFHRNEYNSTRCVLADCDKVLDNSKLLARHIILKHCDLESLQIYGKCPDCDFGFSNFLNFNKHSCCRNVKRKVGQRNYCDICELELYSYKRFVFHLQCHTTKRRPKVCLLCDRLYSDMEEFFEHVHYHHENTYSCNICDRPFKNQKLLKSHIAGHAGKIYECIKCSADFEYKEMLHKHMKKEHQNMTSLQCEVCSKTLANKVIYQKHMKSHIPEAEVQVYLCYSCGKIGRERDDLLNHLEAAVNTNCSETTIQQDILSTAYTCEFCSADFRCAFDLKSHRSTGVHKDNLYECFMCKEKFKNRKSLAYHTKVHDSYEAWQLSFPLRRLWMCNIGECEANFVQWTALYTHKVRHHKPNTACKNNFKDSEQLVNHKKTCQQNVEYKCQFCKKFCPTKMSLAIHISRSHNNKNVTCPNCKASYKDKEALLKHIDYMHVRVQCSHCHKTIANRRNLQTHKRQVHIKQERHFCAICRKGFFHKSEMEVHAKNTHANVVYKCADCSFTTNYNKSMDIHMAMHNKEYQFKCSICFREFGRKHAFDLHMKRHQSTRPYICSDRIDNGCTAAFVSNYLLNKHIRQRHTLKSESETEDCEPPTAKRLKSTKLLPKFQQRSNDVSENFEVDDVGSIHMMHTDNIEEMDDCIVLDGNGITDECIGEFVEQQVDDLLQLNDIE